MCNQFIIQSELAFNFITAFMQTLRTIVIVKFMGLEKLTNAFGLSTLAMGLASIVGNPIAAKLKDVTGQFTMPFIWFGALNLVAGVLWMILPCTHSWETKRNEK